ncbi:hypothetical protein, partial [Dyella sp.]|uniref:hypothetical protein n=1 Tax=Dyella sp. TaxID=1869338 RepID=UPI002841F2AF
MAVDTGHQSNLPLKGKKGERDKKEITTATQTTGAAATDSETARFRVKQVRRVDRTRLLIVLKGYVRDGRGALKPIE